MSGFVCKECGHYHIFKNCPKCGCEVEIHPDDFPIKIMGGD
jgi:rRNA maturation protein Nop10